MEKEIKIRKDGFMAKLILASYKSKELPKSLCPFFWKLLFAFILLPLQWPFVWYNYKKIGKWTHDNQPWVANVFLTLFCYLVLTIYFIKMYHNPVEILTTTGAIAGTLILGFGIIILVVLIVEKYKDYRDKKRWSTNSNIETKKTTLLTEFIKGVKNKYCPRITWLEDGQEYTGCKKD